MTLPILTTERLILTPVAVSDFDDIASLWREPDFVRAIMDREPLSEEEVWFRVLRDLGHWQTMGHGNWTIRLKSDSADVSGAYVGGVGVLNYRRACTPPIDAPELGWGVAPAFQGQGLARESLDAALAWTDTALKAARTVCMISPTNTQSLKLAARVGYRPYAEGTYHGGAVVLLERSTAYAGH